MAFVDTLTRGKFAWKSCNIKSELLTYIIRWNIIFRKAVCSKIKLLPLTQLKWRSSPCSTFSFHFTVEKQLLKDMKSSVINIVSLCFNFYFVPSSQLWKVVPVCPYMCVPILPWLGGVSTSGQMLWLLPVVSDWCSVGSAKKWWFCLK